MWDKFCNLIKKNNIIYLFHHTYPDYDSQGAVYGLANWIKNNFESKVVIIVNSENNIINSDFKIYKYDTKNNCYKNSVGIALDVNHYSRIDGLDIFNKCETKVRIDHHKVKNNDFFDFSIIDESAAAVCEMLAYNLYNCKQYKFSKETGKFFLYGIITDTGRFLHNNINENIFQLAKIFLQLDVDFEKIYQKLYLKNINVFKLEAYICSNFVTKNNTAYFILTEKLLNEFNVPFVIGKSLVFLLSTIKTIDKWCLVTENKIVNNYSVSLRSRPKIDIRTFAENFNGGGHKNASGIKASSIEEVNFILDKLIKYE